MSPATSRSAEPPSGIVSSPQGDYALIDFGDGRRLERLGPWLVDRPAPQADNPRVSPHWDADWTYDAPRTAAGRWAARGNLNAALPAPRNIEVAGQRMTITFGNGGQVGLYPEHIACWSWLSSLLQHSPPGTPMLNLFAASGGASVAAALRGATVTHVDAQNSALKLGHANLQANPDAMKAGSTKIIREDVLRYVERASRREQRYPVIVLDPPSFGRGPKGQTWSLKRDLPALLETLAKLLPPQALGLWLSTHTPGWDAAALSRLLRERLPGATVNSFSLGVAALDGRVLPSGHAAIARWPT